MQHDYFQTLSRELEQFLYCHDIVAIQTGKDSFGMTVWTYERTPFLDQVVREFEDIIARRQSRRRK